MTDLLVIADWIARLPDLDSLQHSSISELSVNKLRLKEVRFPIVVAFDTADEVWVGGV